MTKSLITRASRGIKAAALVDLSRGRSYVGNSGIAAPADMAGQMQTMQSVPTLFAIVDRLATSAASAEWKLYRVTNSGKRTEVNIHPALSVWNRPNEFYTQRELVESLIQHYELTGEMWWLLSSAEQVSVPVEIWPVRPDRMRPVPSPSSFIDHYVYKGVQEVRLSLDEVIYTKRQNPLDPYRGMSPVGALIYDLEGERAASAYNAQFFKNNATPGGIIETDEFMSDTEFDQLQMRWNEQHRGLQNAHRHTEQSK